MRKSRSQGFLRGDAIFAILAGLTLVVALIIISAGEEEKKESPTADITRSASLLASGEIRRAQTILDDLPEEQCADLTLYDISAKEQEYIIKNHCIDPRYTNASIDLARQSVSHEGQIYLVEVRVWDLPSRVPEES